MKVSARNSIKGTIKEIKRGNVNAEVTIEISPGTELTSIITLNSLDSLGLHEGQEAYAVIKASNVMIGVDH